MKYNTLYTVITICIAVLLLAVLLVGFKQCSDQSKHREACLQRGTSTEDCRRLFPMLGQTP